MAGILSERHAMRRAQKARIKARAVRRARAEYVSWWWDEQGMAEALARYVQFYETPQRCSGRCCGNERQWEGMTVQELRQIDARVNARRPGRKRSGPYELWIRYGKGKWWRKRTYATHELAWKNLQKAQREFPWSEHRYYEIRVKKSTR